MRSRRPTSNSAVAFIIITLSGLFAGWAGCSANGSSGHVTGGTGGSTATMTASSTGGSSTGGSSSTGGTGLGGAGASDGGTDAAPTCTSTQKVCNGICVETSDPAYGCDPTFCTPCANYANAMATCSAGACALGNCNTGFKNCDGDDTNGCEANVQTDPTQCGACGSACVVPNATASCVAGVCGIATCTAGYTDCNSNPLDGCEANLGSDPNNCGTCAMVCPGLETCSQGACGIVCGKGTADCNVPQMPTDTCQTPLYTNKNCNFCGDSCNLPNANSQCTNVNGVGTCNLGTCQPGYANCDTSVSNGCETNTNTDANNCNSCGNACPFGPHSTAVCTTGVCGITCDPGYTDCDGNPANGCEVNTGADNMNCGMCKNICSQNNATETCVSGVCVINPCQSPYLDCNKNPVDGCEVNPQGDINNCGSCGNPCATVNGTPNCVTGTCGIKSCTTGYAHCKTMGTDCDTHTDTDVNNCGKCGNACSTNNGAASCMGGVCSIQCTTGYGNCDGDITNGCEAPLNTITNCGACLSATHLACTTANGTPTCNTATKPPSCAASSCSYGYANCPGNGADCSTFILGNDANNCGGCGIVCPSGGGLHDTGACVAGVCTIGTCSPGWADCDGTLANGCEVQLGTLTNCASCGHGCSTANGTPECNPSGTTFVCAIKSCNSGYANCPANIPTDCGTAIATDNNNCGACGTVCESACGGTTDHVLGAACNAGKCGGLVCTPPYVDFDGVCANGCECNASATQTACGNATNLFSGALQPGQSITPYTANMGAVGVSDAYFTLTFGSNTSTSFHPIITISSPNNEFQMDITGNCAGSLLTSCTDNGTGESGGVTTWETSYGGVSPAGDPTSWPVSGSHFNPIPAPGASGQVWIKVHRKTGATPTCNSYTISASD